METGFLLQPVRTRVHRRPPGRWDTGHGGRRKPPPLQRARGHEVPEPLFPQACVHWRVRHCAVLAGIFNYFLIPLTDRARGEGGGFRTFQMSFCSLSALTVLMTQDVKMSKSSSPCPAVK